jgi:hypothetical protein
MKKHDKIAKIILALIITFAATPTFAYAASFENFIWSEPNPTYLNSSVIVKQRTYSQGWGVPFVSNWRTELQGFTWNTPSNQSWTGNLGTWTAVNGGAFISDWVWVCQGPEVWFYGETTWWAWTGTSAKQSHNARLIAHGEHDTLLSSIGSTTYWTTMCY